MRSERRYRSIPLARRWIHDIVHFGKKSHVVGGAWQLNLAPLVAARSARHPLIGWSAIWIKALALVSRRRACLRTSYMPFPWARLYVHPECVSTVVIERIWQGQPAVFFEQIAGPERRALAEIDHELRKLKQVPIESVGSFRRLIRFARPPLFVRRPLWSLMLYWSGPLRTKYVGTCAINSFPTGASVSQTAMPISFLLFYGLVGPNGEVPVQVFFDHRVMDGIEVYRLMREVEATMNRDIVAELKAETGEALVSIAAQ
jgi:hypothetical protein